MARISTGTGDDGTTGLVDGSRVRKTHPLVVAFGAVDEANAAVGAAAALAQVPATRAALEAVSRDLFTLGADLATPPATEGALRISAADAERVTAWSTALEEALPPLKHFVLPGGTPAAAALHVARTVTRRAERHAWDAHEAAPVNGDALVYLNRLSDWLFLAARAENATAGVAEPEWKGRG